MHSPARSLPSVAARMPARRMPARHQLLRDPGRPRRDGGHRLPQPGRILHRRPCAISKPGAVAYAAPDASAIAAANTPVTVFAAGAVPTGCDFVNTGTAVLYLDFTTSAAAGAATSIPLQPGQSFHCPYPPLGAVTAVAAQPQPFVAIRY